MPTYVYECERCGHRFEVLQQITDPPRSRCPECRGKVRKVITSGGGLIFKGSGFYITDYKRKESPPPPVESEAGGKDAPAPAEGGKKEKAPPESKSGKGKKKGTGD